MSENQAHSDHKHHCKDSASAKQYCESSNTGKNHCGSSASTEKNNACHSTGKIDFLLWGSLVGVAIFYWAYLLLPDAFNAQQWYGIMTSSVFELMNRMWWGIALGMLMVGIIGKVPREYVTAIMGSDSGLNGILRATFAGVLLDLCNHGLLMVAAKMYERGVSIAQIMAFLIASPWNSFSLTIILVALIGLWWTVAFIVLSMIIAVVTGLVLSILTKRGVLPANPHQVDLPQDFKFWREAKNNLKKVDYSPRLLLDIGITGLRESRMVLRWILFGILLASVVRSFVSPEMFGTLFGPTLAGLGLTILAGTLIEVCSEGSTPIAADILTKASAPGNAFAFLMTGVSTDYTEFVVLRDVTKSWRIPLFLPLLTLPQIFVLSWLMNMF